MFINIVTMRFCDWDSIDSLRKTHELLYTSCRDISGIVSYAWSSSLVRAVCRIGHSPAPLEVGSNKSACVPILARTVTLICFARSLSNYRSSWHGGGFSAISTVMDT